MIAFLIVTAGILFLYKYNVLDRADRYLDCIQEADKALVEPGETIAYTVTVVNRSFWLFPYIRASVYFPGAFELPGEEVREESSWQKTVSRSMMILPKGKVSFRLQAVCGKRGRYTLHDVLLQSGDSLGLSTKFFRRHSDGEIVVIPKKLVDEQLERTIGGFLGNVSVRRFIHEDPVLSAGFREYTGQEPMKQISWKQSAKGLGLMVKVPDYTADPVLCLILNTDTQAPDREELIERTLIQARTVCEQLEKHRFAYRILMNAACTGALSSAGGIGHGTGDEHYRLAMEMLGRASYACERSFGQLAQQAMEQNDQTAGYLILTPSFSDRLPGDFLARLSAHSGTEAVLLCGEAML
ncbi:MAG: DUF58 domain-containing protein [Solobacterium sp.]|nr:DUF58 domain-containing protein [Solobacterium sp.]